MRRPYSKRVTRKWHRWGRFRFYIGDASSPFGSYGWGFSKERRPRCIRLGPLYAVVWPKRNA